ncbi:hypothetical protein [Polyangium sp. y55x31]|nr:hypothetical protein [Polyangium sp. y55x31]MDI1482807.1 hypothetical protein [Polyangium sp. y55x31]
MAWSSLSWVEGARGRSSTQWTRGAATNVFVYLRGRPPADP